MTAAPEAARSALTWALRAEAAVKQVDEHRKRARELEAQRHNSDAAHARALVEHWERFRGESVDMANMWANVAGALRPVEKG